MAGTDDEADVPVAVTREDGWATLRDGSEVELHAMRAEDAVALLRFHHGLSADTTYLRFFSVHPELGSDELYRFTHVDHRDREAIVATSGSEIVGVARLDRIGKSGEAEVAFVVGDDWQGRGLGHVLFDRLAERGRRLGLTRFVADVLPQNHRMLAVFRHAGLPCSSSLRDGVVHVVVELATPQVTTADATAK